MKPERRLETQWLEYEAECQQELGRRLETEQELERRLETERLERETEHLEYEAERQQLLAKIKAVELGNR